MEENDFPISFICPISRRMFSDPVILGLSGHTFERVEIETWLQYNETNPLTNQRLLSKVDLTLVPNYNLRQSIEHYIQLNVGKILNSLELTGNVKLNDGSQKESFQANYKGNIVVISRAHHTILADNEYKVYAGLGYHPHLVRYIGRACVDTNNEVVKGELNSVVTEFAPLSDLSSHFRFLANRGEKLTLHHMLLIAEQVADGMTAVHAAGIIHSDLSARNVMVFALDVNFPNRTVVKVGNYGIATFTGEQSSVCAVGNNSISSFRWMSPEAIRSRRWSKQSDIWSFGVLLWEILTQGDFPFANLHDDEIAKGIDQVGLRLSRPTECPEDIWQIVTRCWADKPNERPSIIELKASFHQLLSKFTISLTPSFSHSISIPLSYQPLLEAALSRRSRRRIANSIGGNY